MRLVAAGGAAGGTTGGLELGPGTVVRRIGSGVVPRGGVAGRFAGEVALTRAEGLGRSASARRTAGPDRGAEADPPTSAPTIRTADSETAVAAAVPANQTSPATTDVRPTRPACPSDP